MLIYDKNVLYKKMVEELKMNDAIAKLILESLVDLDNRLQEPLDKWLSVGNADDFSFDGINIASIKERLRFNFIHALYTMDTYMNDENSRKIFKSEMNKPLFID